MEDCQGLKQVFSVCSVQCQLLTAAPSALLLEALKASPSIEYRAELPLLFTTVSASPRNVPSGSPIVIESIKGCSVSRSLNANVGK